MKKINIPQYLKKIQSFYKDRLKYLKPEFFIFTVTIVIAVFIFICFSVYLHPEGSRYCFHFYLEEGSITILSGTALAAASLLAYTCFFIKPTISKRQKVFFLIVALALTFLTLDEVMHFHEQVGENLDSFRFMRKITRTTGIRSWNDMIIILYGIVALPVLIYFLPTALEIPYIAEFFIAAFLCYATHTAIDSFVEPPTAASYIIEESLKLYTSTFLAMGLLSGLLFLINPKSKDS